MLLVVPKILGTNTVWVLFCHQALCQHTISDDVTGPGRSRLPRGVLPWVSLCTFNDVTMQCAFVRAFPICWHMAVFIGTIITYIIDPDFQTRMDRHFCLTKRNDGQLVINLYCICFHMKKQWWTNSNKSILCSWNLHPTASADLCFSDSTTWVGSRYAILQLHILPCGQARDPALDLSQKGGSKMFPVVINYMK